MQAEDIVFNMFKGLHYYEEEEIGGIDPKAYGEPYFEAGLLRIVRSLSSERLREMDSSLSDTELIIRGDKKDLERLSKSDNPDSNYLANKALKGRKIEELIYLNEPKKHSEDEMEWAYKEMDSSDEYDRLSGAMYFLENDAATFKD